jgi:putative ABC transport system permease protein
VQDLRLAVRALRATPVLTGVAVLSLALGIGANTAIFSLVDSLLLRTLPVADPQRLVRLLTTRDMDGRNGFSYAALDQIRKHRDAFDGAIAYSNCCGIATLTFDGVTGAVQRGFVSGDFFEVLGVSPVVGRLFTPADDVDGGGPNGLTAVISYKLWRDRFGGSTRVIDASVIFERLPVTIIGVTPPDFHGIEVGQTFDVMLPIKTEPIILPSIAFDDHIPWFSVMLRTKPGVSLEAATAALRAVQPQIRAAAMPSAWPAALRSTFLTSPFVLVPAGMGTSALRTKFERPLIALLIVVGLVLLIACANIANLMLARAAARRHEISVRLAIGASTWRLMRQLLAESAVLAGLGTMCGVAFGIWATQLLVAQLSTSATPAALNLSPDWRVLGFTAVTMVTVVMVCGLIPALRATHVAPIDALRQHGRVADDAVGRLGGGLVVAQVALSLVLVVAAGLFVRTFERLLHAPLGMETDRTLLVTLTAPTVSAADRNTFYHRLVNAAASVPGVSHAGGTLNPPIAGTLTGDFILSRPGEQARPDAEVISQFLDVTPGLLASYGIPIRGGRDFDERDNEKAPPVMLVNEALAQRYFPGQNLIGTHLALTVRGAQTGDVLIGIRTVVGVVGDAAYRSIRAPMRPTIYTPLAQHGDKLLQTYFYIAVRSSSRSPALLTRSVAAALRTVNPDLTLEFRPLTTIVDESLAQDRLVAALAGFFGALALLLAGLGLYGVTAYAVAQRRAEIGIRMALGAQPAGVIRLVLSRVAWLVALGVMIGVSVSAWASRFVASLVYGLAPRDPATLIGATVTLATIATLAGWLPAYRASRVDPAEVLRES